MASALEDMVSRGQFYEALQLYKIKSFRLEPILHFMLICVRYATQKKFEEAKAILVSGVDAMITHSHPECAGELSYLLVELCERLF